MSGARSITQKEAPDIFTDVFIEAIQILFEEWTGRLNKFFISDPFPVQKNRMLLILNMKKSMRHETRLH
jgi:hypothetical protein